MHNLFTQFNIKRGVLDFVKVDSVGRLHKQQNRGNEVCASTSSPSPSKTWEEGMEKAAEPPTFFHSALQLPEPFANGLLLLPGMVLLRLLKWKVRKRHPDPNKKPEPVLNANKSIQLLLGCMKQC